MTGEPTEANPFEQRARAVKAFKLARFALRDLEPQLGDRLVSALEVARPPQRRRLARLAHVNDPSDATWEVMLGLLEEMLRNRRSR